MTVLGRMKKYLARSLRSPHQRRIEEFMRLAKQAVPTVPGVPDTGVRSLRAKLILEEALETIKALGFDAYVNPSVGDVHLLERYEPNLAQIADGCCDISVVTVGTLSACGIPDRPCLSLVDESNLAKFGPGHSIREDGKLIKPPDFQPPDFEGLLVQLAYFAIA